MFAAPVLLSTGNRPSGLQTADLNGDGKLDLVALSGSDNSVSVLFNTGNGTFGPATTYSVVSNPQDMTLADFNGDSHPDIVVGSYHDNSVYSLLNDGTGHFGTPIATNARGGVTALYAADFNGDGKTDVVVGVAISSLPATFDIGFLQGNGDGTFVSPADANFQPVEGAFSRRNFIENMAPDLNGDGKPDVVFGYNSTGDGSDNYVTVGLNRGDGTFAIAQYVASPGPGGSSTRANVGDPNSVAVGDSNDDGKPDIAVLATGGVQGGPQPRDIVAFNNGVGTFTPVIGYPPPNMTGTDLAIGDFNGDGKPDIAVLDVSGSVLGSGLQPAQIDIYTYGPTPRKLSNGDRTFQPPVVYADGQGNYDVKMADVNCGGVPDILVANASSGLDLLPGNDDRTFGAPQAIATGSLAVRSVAVGDLNGEGRTDMVVSHDSNSDSINGGTHITVLLAVTAAPPTLDPIADRTVAENAGAQVVNLTGISPGAGNSGQTLTVSAVSSNPALIPNPTVAYTSPNSTGTLTFTPAAGQFGTAVITVTASESGETATATRRLVRLFLQDESRGGRRPVFGDNLIFQADPHWRDHIPFYEYFHGDNGAGLGASHQTGWTALVAELIGWEDGQCGTK
jgi:hypothetical protein